jgi:ADP-heptose:LPS heptosyltransferase
VWLQLGEEPPAALAALPSIERPTMAGDWLDTARLVESLDGVVSVDTGMAHLAGAMGVPLHLLLPYTPDWRWGWQGASTGWYPTAVLHRQAAPADWTGALTTLREALTI